MSSISDLAVVWFGMKDAVIGPWQVVGILLLVALIIFWVMYRRRQM